MSFDSFVQNSPGIYLPSTQYDDDSDVEPDTEQYPEIDEFAPEDFNIPVLMDFSDRADTVARQHNSGIELRDIVRTKLDELGQYEQELGPMGNNACSVRTVFGKFPKLRTLGKGAHGIAEEVKINDKHKMAVKVQYLLDDSELDEVNQELSIMDAVTLDKSPNKDLVALYFGTCTDRDGQYDGNSMIFEFMELAEGSLESLLDKSNSQNLMKNPRQFMSIMKQVMFTMCWLVSRFDIVHNDLYPRNIVYVHTKTPKMYRLDINDETLILKVAAGEICIKIIDFGHASSTQKFDQVNDHQYIQDLYFSNPSSAEDFFVNNDSAMLGKQNVMKHVLAYDLPYYCRDLLSMLGTMRQKKWQSVEVENWIEKCFSYIRDDVVTKGEFSMFTMPQGLYEAVLEFFSVDFLRSCGLDSMML